MTDQVTVNAEGRNATGKGTARRLRRDGFVPAVMYGRGEASTHVQIRADVLEALLKRINAATTVIDLKVDGGRATKVLIREMQKHPFRRQILHLDFFQIREDEKIRVAVPLHLGGTPVGVTEGGILQQIRHEINVECLPGEIPEAFQLDVSAMVVGDSFHVGDIDTGDVTILDDLDLTVSTVVPPMVEVVEEEEEEELVEGVEGEAVEGEAAEGETEGEGPEKE